MSGPANARASEMSHQVDERLRAALQEMDDIMKVSFDGTDMQEEEFYMHVKTHTDELVKELKSCSNTRKALEKLPISTVGYLRSWLLTSDRNSGSVHGSNNEMNVGYGGQLSDETGYSSSNHSSSSTADMKQLEVENENFKKQIRSLQSQVQDTKGHLMVAENRLANSNEKLMKAEERLHKEQVNKTYMESHKLDLMAEVAELRLRLQSVEAERVDYKDRYEGLQNQVLELHEKLILRERELGELKTQINRNGYHHMNGGPRHILNSGIYFGSLDREGMRLKRQNSEMENMKKMVNDLVSAGQEKDRKISELRKAVSTYQRVEEIILQSHGRPRSSGSESCGSTNERTVKANEQIDRPTSGLADRQVNSVRQNGTFPAMTSTPVNNTHQRQLADINQCSTITSTPTAGNGHGPPLVKRSNSYDAAKFHKVVMADKEPARTPATSRKANLNVIPTRAGSVVHTNGALNNPADAETDATSDDDDIHAKEEHKKKKAGFRKFFSRLKKSSSQEALDEIGNGNNAFKRGGIRATAGPRLGWGSNNRAAGQRLQGADEPRTPFHQWDSVEVANWLSDMGLNIYSSECKRWNKSGRHFLETAQHDIDKELRIANPLHRKKLHLALEAERSGSRKDQLLYNLKPDWVFKWLDDIGLPQYKEQFSEAKVDSRMLNYITVEDLLYMKITNAIHHCSIRRGIEVLRKHNFDLSALKRRPSISGADVPPNTASTQDPTLWTNHRVMEWLRSVDLSEYAANLRGSGVNGALIMLEPKFSVEHLASILNIPTSKTLLRRHLTAHFINLVGKEMHDQKNETENGLRVEINTKVKSKKNPFKKGRSGTDYLCPLDLAPIDAREEDERIKKAVAMYKKELNKAEKPKMV